MHNLRSWLSIKTKRLSSYSASQSLSARSLPEANKWILSEFILKKLIPVVGIRPYPLDEMLLMCSAVAYFNPDIILEWGTHFGVSARIFYELIVYLNYKTQIHSIDIPPDQEHIENIHDSKQRGMLVRGLPVKLHLGDGLTVSNEIYADVNPTLPLFFIDGDHSFNSVWKELNGIKEIATRAVVLAHDVFLQGKESGYNCGPFEALSKFTNQYQLPLQTTILGLPGMGLTYWL